jgi:hypothetical protein
MFAASRKILDRSGQDDGQNRFGVADHVGQFGFPEIRIDRHDGGAEAIERQPPQEELPAGFRAAASPGGPCHSRQRQAHRPAHRDLPAAS